MEEEAWADGIEPWNKARALADRKGVKAVAVRDPFGCRACQFVVKTDRGGVGVPQQAFLDLRVMRQCAVPVEMIGA